MSGLVLKRRALRKAVKLAYFAGLCLLVTACRQVPKTVQAEPSTANQNAIYGPPRIIARLRNPSINESSGLVASHTMPGVYWTHNDSGGGPFIYAIDTKGETIGVWRVTGVDPDDWEDISIGPGPESGKTYLYIGDIGDNSSSRKDIVVYRLAEPKALPEDRKSSKARPLATETPEAIHLRYPDGKHDAETLLVHPVSGNIYVITKVALQNATIYEAVAPQDSSKLTTMKRLGEVKLPSIFGGILTGGSVSPDGKHVALCDYFQAYEIALPDKSANFDEIWKQSLVSLDFGKRNQGESIAYRLDGNALLGTGEGRGAEIIEVLRK